MPASFEELTRFVSDQWILAVLFLIGVFFRLLIAVLSAIGAVPCGSVKTKWRLIGWVMNWGLLGFFVAIVFILAISFSKLNDQDPDEYVNTAFPDSGQVADGPHDSTMPPDTDEADEIYVASIDSLEEITPAAEPDTVALHNDTVMKYYIVKVIVPDDKRWQVFVDSEPAIVVDDTSIPKVYLVQVRAKGRPTFFELRRRGQKVRSAMKLIEKDSTRIIPR